RQPRRRRVGRARDRRARARAGARAGPPPRRRGAPARERRMSAAAPAVPPVYRAGLAAWAALLALQLVWHGWLAPSPLLPTWLVLALTVLPLLLPLLAIRDVRRALLWTGILALFYFSHGVAEA